MNTRIVLSSRPEKLPYFPELEVKKHRRVVTKHFTNTALWLSSDEFMLLNWLVYQTAADNTLKYSTKLLEQFIAAIKAARDEYWNEFDREIFNITLKTTFFWRKQMVSLIQQGLILPTSRKGYLMINPMLTYNADVVNNKKYKEVQEKYQLIPPGELIHFTDYYCKLVASYLESKKPNYKYGKRR